MQLDRGYLKFSYFVGGQFVTTLEGGVSHITHPPSYFGDGTERAGGFGENRVDAEVFAEYRLSDSFGLNGTFRYDANLGSRELPLVPGSPVVDDLNFQRFQAYLGARWFM